MPEPLDASHYTNQAKKCRRLAKHADEETAKALLALAEECEAKAIEVDESGA
jgi:hypothetical protein